MFVFVQLFGNGATFFFAKKMEMIRRLCRARINWQLIMTLKPVDHIENSSLIQLVLVTTSTNIELLAHSSSRNTENFNR